MSRSRTTTLVFLAAFCLAHFGLWEPSRPAMADGSANGVYSRQPVTAKKVVMNPAGAEIWEEPNVLIYSVPKGWVARHAQERWLGADPSFALRKGKDRIQITHYGLKESRFQNPEAFIDWLRKIFKIFQEAEKSDTISLAGKNATLIRTNYSLPEGADQHGGFILGESFEEEFVVLPLQEGFSGVHPDDAAHGAGVRQRCRSRKAGRPKGLEAILGKYFPQRRIGTIMLLSRHGSGGLSGQK